jgi:hypothetical protein
VAASTMDWIASDELGLSILTVYAIREKPLSNFSFSITAASFHVARYLAFEFTQLCISDSGALNAPYLVAHHDTAEEITEGRRPGIVAAGLLAFIRNKTCPSTMARNCSPWSALHLTVVTGRWGSPSLRARR